jgi:hypothetical protein
MKARTIARILPVLLLLFAGFSYGQQVARPAPKHEQHLSKQSNLHVTLGTISVGVFYANAPCPVFAYGCYPVLPFVAPYAYPLFYPAFLYASADFARHVPEGTVKLHASPANAAIYIDGAYAGTANRLKTFPLGSGAYDLDVKAQGYRTFHERIYILSDRTLQIAARLEPLPPQPGGKP